LSKWLTHLQVSTDLVDKTVVIHEHYAHENSSARDQDGPLSGTLDIATGGQRVRRWSALILVCEFLSAWRIIDQVLQGFVCILRERLQGWRLQREIANHRI
jgi:hypothetical protein